MKTRLEKTCENCAKPFQQTVSAKGTLETSTRFKKRRYCSLTCAAIGRERLAKRVAA